MLVQTEMGSDPMERSVSILDSPTLARVERAMLRHEQDINREYTQFQRAAFSQSLLSSNFGKESAHAIKRGLLWQQRDKLFSRWKERYFILTRDYLHCFRRASGTNRISEMGQFLFKIKLIDIERIEWQNKKTYSAIALILGREGKIYLRIPEGLEDWFELLEECILASKERRKALRHSHDGKPRANNNISGCLDEWLAARHKLQMRRLQTDIVNTKQDITKCRNWAPREEEWNNHIFDNRLSLLTDIDINAYDDSTLAEASVTSFRLNQDVLCIQPPSLRAPGSFRSTRDSTTFTKRDTIDTKDVHQCQFIKFRERSYSDIQRIDRRPHRTLQMDSRQFNY